MDFEFETSSAIMSAFDMLLTYHYVFSLCILIPCVINLYHLFTCHNYPRLNRKIWFVMPILFFLLGVSLLSGLDLLFFHTAGSRVVVVSIMVLVFCAIGTAEIVRIKMLKKAIRTNEAAFRLYIKRAKIIYLLDIFLLFVAWGVSKIL